MCGIAGIYRFDGQPVDGALLDAMIGRLSQRGPDDAGCFLAGPLGLAFRRLAILDRSPAGHQPMRSPDGALTLVFNGELYNFLDLRAELAARGYPFRSSTDTEVLLAAYATWDLACLPRLRGMWAFALWDARQQRLLCARDRFGIKPFYYHLTPTRFAFASELKALLADPTTPRQPNLPRLADYLVYGYLDHTPETCFAGLLQLPPGHYLLLEAGTPTPTLRRYWTLAPQPALALDAATAAAHIRTLLTASVQRQLQSDVPVGTCLSGGLDSSSIVVLVNQLLQRGAVARTVIGPQQATFSACYADARYDERRYIAAVVAATGVANYRTFPSGEGLLQDLADLIWHQEEPCGSTSVYAQWCVMRLARAHGVTVLLDGQGGDELFAGYPIYQAAWWAALARQGRWSLLRREISAYSRRFGSARALRLREAVRLALPEALAERISAWLGHAQPDWLGDQLRGTQFQRPMVTIPFTDPLRRLLYSFLVAQNLPALLHYEDRSSMAFSIEARVPFLDEELVEFVFALPAEYKLRDGETKWVLRQALRGLLPEAVRTRQDKLGFATPGGDWLRGPLRPLVDEVFAAPCFRQRGYFEVAVLDEIWRRHKAGQADLHTLIWRALNLELWSQRFIDRRPEPP